MTKRLLVSSEPSDAAFLYWGEKKLKQLKKAQPRISKTFYVAPEVMVRITAAPGQQDTVLVRRTAGVFYQLAYVPYRAPEVQIGYAYSPAGARPVPSNVGIYDRHGSRVADGDGAASYSLRYFRTTVDGPISFFLVGRAGTMVELEVTLIGIEPTDISVEMISIKYVQPHVNPANAAAAAAYSAAYAAALAALPPAPLGKTVVFSSNGVTLATRDVAVWESNSLPKTNALVDTINNFGGIYGLTSRQLWSGGSSVRLYEQVSGFDYTETSPMSFTVPYNAAIPNWLDRLAIDAYPIMRTSTQKTIYMGLVGGVTYMYGDIKYGENSGNAMTLSERSEAELVIAQYLSDRTAAIERNRNYRVDYSNAMIEALRTGTMPLEIAKTLQEYHPKGYLLPKSPMVTTYSYALISETFEVDLTTRVVQGEVSFSYEDEDEEGNVTTHSDTRSGTLTLYTRRLGDGQYGYMFYGEYVFSNFPVLFPSEFAKLPGSGGGVNDFMRKCVDNALYRYCKESFVRQPDSFNVLNYEDHRVVGGYDAVDLVPSNSINESKIDISRPYGGIMNGTFIDAPNNDRLVQTYDYYVMLRFPDYPQTTSSVMYSELDIVDQYMDRGFVQGELQTAVKTWISSLPMENAIYKFTPITYSSDTKNFGMYPHPDEYSQITKATVYGTASYRFSGNTFAFEGWKPLKSTNTSDSFAFTSENDFSNMLVVGEAAAANGGPIVSRPPSDPEDPKYIMKMIAGLL